MAATDTIPTGIDGRPLSAEDRRQSIGGDLDTARAFAIAAMKAADKFETRVVHARIAIVVHDLDEALRELASS